MPRSLPNRLWQAFIKYLARLTAVTLFHVRVRGERLMPPAGGGLVMSNHQSNLDPVIIGLCCERRLNYVARQTLLTFAPLRWLLNSLDTIPIDRDGIGLGGLKETLRRLKRGELVLLFPEGTRTRDGEVQAIKPGFCALARRAEVPLVPVAMDGAFDAWPRQRGFPRPAVIHVQFGEPILPEQVKLLSDEQLVREVERRIRDCHVRARITRRHAAGIGDAKLASELTSG